MEKINKNSSTESFSKVSINWYPRTYVKNQKADNRRFKTN